MANYLERVKDKLESATPSWVSCSLDQDEKVHITLDLKGYVASTETKVDDKVLDVFEKFVDNSSVLFPLLGSLVGSFSKKEPAKAG